MSLFVILIILLVLTIVLSGPAWLAILLGLLLIPALLWRLFIAGAVLAALANRGNRF